MRVPLSRVKPILLIWLALLFPLTACGGVEVTQGTYKVGKPYQVNGVWYYPREDASYNETGLASWYGDDFHGKRTANGETFDMALMTAAHKTLPMPVLVRVTNLSNGKSTVLRVNDRGPFVHGRIIDVSAKAAELLGFKERGVAPVRVQYLTRAPLDPSVKVAADDIVATPRGQEMARAAPTSAVATSALPAPGQTSVASLPPPPAPSRPAGAPASLAAAPASLAPPAVVETVPVTGATRIYVQAGAFASPTNAQSLRARLSGLGATSVSPASVEGQRLYRVRLGPFESATQADAMLERVLKLGIAGAAIVID